MQILIWAVFVAGAFASRYFFGLEGRLFYSVVVLLAIVLFRRQLVIGLTQLASKFGLMKATIDKMPMTIRLVEGAIDPAAGPSAAELSKAGFVDAGAWIIPPLPKIRLALMIHPVDSFLAAIETASSIGAQVNVHTLYADGSVMTFTNSRLPAPKAQRPGMTNLRVPGAPVDALLARARTGRRRDGISAVTVDDAPRVYERLYADSIKFRKQRGA
ncbi:MAG TPA: hypothetical protein VLB69_01210 [Rudaea sp.]|nr:hypothetical protein [Rudaea sp.]